MKELNVKDEVIKLIEDNAGYLLVAKGDETLKAPKQKAKIKKEKQLNKQMQLNSELKILKKQLEVLW